MKQAGFRQVDVQQWWEIRAKHPNKEALKKDLAERTGRSILHDLTDDELERLICFIMEQLPSNQEIIEEDRWTIWIGKKMKIRQREE
jgi:hypothetical protein